MWTGPEGSPSIVQQGEPRVMIRTSGRRATRWVVRVTVGALALGLVWLLTCWTVLQHPRIDRPAASDALFVLGPPDRIRMERALQLMDGGVAPVMVVANPGTLDLSDSSGNTYYARAAEVCDAEMGYEVICFQPDPSTTQGEAMKLRELAEHRGWDRVSALTFRQHVPRARLLLERCYAGELDMLAFDYRFGPSDVLRQFRYQSGAFVKAWVTPGCDQQLPGRPKSLG